MPTYEFWRQTLTDELWAVVLENGRVVAACGPLDARDMTRAMLPHLPYSEHLGGSVRGNVGSFRPARVGDHVAGRRRPPLLAPPRPRAGRGRAPRVRRRQTRGMTGT
jgi:hypothetical protein